MERSRRELIRKFRTLGFSGPVSGGRHQFMEKGSLKVRIPNPHGSDTIDGPLVREILRQASIRMSEWKKA
ncbi:MAG: type II toxin-antitoxin system HicA family toxin [Bryobacteraceae bacterium]